MWPVRDAARKFIDVQEVEQIVAIGVFEERV